MGAKKDMAQRKTWRKERHGAKKDMAQRKTWRKERHGAKKKGPLE